MNAIGKRISVLLLVCMLLRCGGLPAFTAEPETKYGEFRDSRFIRRGFIGPRCALSRDGSGG